jgi:Zn finger protein HypA/HybF involved in hydrogenase expression
MATVLTADWTRLDTAILSLARVLIAKWRPGHVVCVGCKAVWTDEQWDGECPACHETLGYWGQSSDSEVA